MLDLKFIRENQDLIKKNCADRMAAVDVDELLKLDTERRELINQIDQLRAERNQSSKTKPDEEQIAKLKQLGQKVEGLEQTLVMTEKNLQTLLLAVPNLTHPDVKVSADEDDNPVLETIGEIPNFKLASRGGGFEPKDHVQLAADLDLIEFERATKVTGAKFYYLKNDLARLELALVNYVLDIIRAHGYTFMTTPDLAKTDLIERLGFSPRGASTQVYNIEDSDLSLIGTAEITLGGLYADEVLSLDDLPIKLVGLSHCFRTEAGSYSKFAKGIFRVHQFTKAEMFVYCQPEDAESLHQEILEIEKEIFSGLAIPFRIVDHCTADLGNPSYRTFDLEAWLPASAKATAGETSLDNKKGAWREITSTSNCTDYQARGLNIKYQTAGDDKQAGERRYVYTLNGTGVATTRALIAILENYQQADGSIVIPEVLRSYLNKQKNIK